MNFGVWVGVCLFVCLFDSRANEESMYFLKAEAVLEKKGTHQKVLTLKEYTNETPEDLLDRMGKEYIAEGAPKQVNLSGRRKKDAFVFFLLVLTL